MVKTLPPENNDATNLARSVYNSHVKKGKDVFDFWSLFTLYKEQFYTCPVLACTCYVLNYKTYPFAPTILHKQLDGISIAALYPILPFNI